MPCFWIVCKCLVLYVQELRVQFAGAVPLSRQEKFSRQMMQLQQDKQKLEIELKQVGGGV